MDWCRSCPTDSYIQQWVHWHMLAYETTNSLLWPEPRHRVSWDLMPASWSMKLSMTPVTFTVHIKKSMMLNLVGTGGIGGPAESWCPLALEELRHRTFTADWWHSHDSYSSILPITFGSKTIERTTMLLLTRSAPLVILDEFIAHGRHSLAPVNNLGLIDVISVG